MKNKNLLLGSFLILSINILPLLETGQDPQLHHLRCIGGTGEDGILYVIKLRDGNFLSCGYTDSKDGDFDVRNQSFDAFLLKTNADGDIIWKKTYGGSHDEVFYNIMETASGDILAIGTSGSNDKVTNHHGTPGTDDVWLVKTSSDGQLAKERCYGGSKSESTWDLGQSEGIMTDRNGNILFVGQTNSNDGDVSGNHGDYDGWLVKINPNTFDIIKSTTIGTANYEAAYNIYEIRGDLFVTGCNADVPLTTTNEKTVEDLGGGFATKIDAITFNTKWYRSYGGSGSEYCNASVISADSNLVLTGHAASTDGDCVGNNGDFNAWTWKINVSDGSIVWKNFASADGVHHSPAFNLIATQDGGYAALGLAVRDSKPDAFVVKIDANGHTQWTKIFGGSRTDMIIGGAEINNGSFLLGGLTLSSDGVITDFHNGSIGNNKFLRFPAGNRTGPKSDAWLVELNGN